MKTFVTFGDPRRADKSVVFSGHLRKSSIRISGSVATVIVSGRQFPGAVLSSQAEGFGAHISILVSPLLTKPGDGVYEAFTRAGFERALVPPRGATVPTVVEATLIVAGAHDQSLWASALWLDRAYVPTQRSTFDTPGGPSLECRVLAMETQTGDGPTILLWADEALVPFSCDGSLPGWRRLHGLQPHPEWMDLARVSEAVEAEVGYLLSTPIVTGAVVHDPWMLRPMDTEWVLPEDVGAEVASALRDDGLDFLLPQG